MAEEGPDYSVAVVIFALIIIWVLNVYIPVLLIRPMWGGVQMLAEIEDTEQVATPPPPPPILLPIIATLGALGLFAFGVHKMREEEEMGGRWLWMTAASAIAFFWALVLIIMTSGAWRTYITQYAATS